MKTIWKLEKCRQPHPLSDYIWDSNLRAVLVFNLYVQEWILASMCLPHRVLCLFHFVQDSPDQGVDAQHSLSTGKMRILFLSKMGLYEQLFWEDDHVSCSMQHLLSIWLLLWQEWCRRLSKAFQIHVLFFLFFFLSWHLLYFSRWYSVSNQRQEQWCNALLTKTESVFGLIT